MLCRCLAARTSTQFMLWYSQAGTPEVIATGSYDPAQKSYRLELTQSVPPTPGQPVKQPMQIPLALGLVGPDGKDLPLTLGGRPRASSAASSTDRGRETIVFTDVADAAGALAQSRLLGTGQAHHQSFGADDLHFLLRTTRIRSTAGRRCSTLAMRILVDRATGAPSNGDGRA